MKKSIAFITDLHLDEPFPIEQGTDPKSNWKTILNDINTRKIDEIIFGGDIGSLSSNQWFFNSLKDFKITTILGNHDQYSEVIKHYNDDSLGNQRELYYIHEHPHYKFIFLDSSSGTISKVQYEWFLESLHTDKHIIAFIHHPILAINALVDKQYALQDRDLIKDALQSINNNVTIFSGHYHFEDECRNDNITQYVTPASSYQVEKIPDKISINAQPFGYRIIEFNDDSFHTEVIMFAPKN